jgi:hypothetical protein
MKNHIYGHFCAEAFGRVGHGHASKSKETLYIKKIYHNP